MSRFLLLTGITILFISCRSVPKFTETQKANEVQEKAITAHQVTPSELPLIWSDEFDYSGVPDRTKWSFDTQGNSWDWGNNEAQNYTPEANGNAWVENDNLIIEARKENWTDPGDGETKKYTSARLITLNKADFTYGRFDIRAKIPTGNGSWPAIWLLASQDVYGGWPDSGEIDIMEYVYNEGERILGTVWCKANETTYGAGSSNAMPNPGADYHIFSVEWDETEIRHYVDGNLFHAYSKTGDWQQWPFDQDMYILLNIAIGGDWNPEIDDAIFPLRFYVDYVRVYDLSGVGLY